MYQDLSKTINEVVNFTNQHRIKAQFNIHHIGDLRGKKGIPDELWATFEKMAGVYVLFDTAHTCVHYIGMSEKDVGTRMDRWLFKDNKVNHALSDSDFVLTISMAEQPYMSPALESYLIGRLSPVLNVRKTAYQIVQADS